MHDHRQILLNRSKTVTVGGESCDIQGFTSGAIRQAVEAIGSSGGTVKLDKGYFRMTGPIRLYDGMTLQGSGAETVLGKSEAVSSSFVVDADYGELQVEVENADGFEIGMGLQIYDQSQKWGWDETAALITGIEGNRLYFDRYLERDYRADDGGMATNACSLIEVFEAKHVRITDLAVNGGKADNFPIGGCRGGGIYLYKAKDCRIEHVLVEDFHGDGISWQITEDIHLSHVEVRGCTGSGLHPGSGSVRSRIADCDLHDNGFAGLFVCWRVQQGEFSRSRFTGNGSCGISIGHKDSDNLFADNVITANGETGIYFREEKESNGADRNLWIRNLIVDNGDAQTGYDIYVSGAAAGNVFEHNRIGQEGRTNAVWLGDQVKDFRFQ